MRPKRLERLAVDTSPRKDTQNEKTQSSADAANTQIRRLLHAEDSRAEAQNRAETLNGAVPPIMPEDLANPRPEARPLTLAQGGGNWHGS